MRPLSLLIALLNLHPPSTPLPPSSPRLLLLPYPQSRPRPQLQPTSVRSSSSLPLQCHSLPPLLPPCLQIILFFPRPPLLTLFLANVSLFSPSSASSTQLYSSPSQSQFNVAFPSPTAQQPQLQRYGSTGNIFAPPPTSPYVTNPSLFSPPAPPSSSSTSLFAPKPANPALFSPGAAQNPALYSQPTFTSNTLALYLSLPLSPSILIII